MSIGTGFWDGRVDRVLGCEGGALDAQPVAFGGVDGWFDSQLCELLVEEVGGEGVCGGLCCCCR